MKKTVDEFKAFIMRGNVVDMAVGVIIGGAFGKIITSLVNDVIMPPIGLLMGKVDFTNLFWTLNGQVYPTLAEAEKAGAPILRYGMFINTVVNFLIVAFVIFLVVKQLMGMFQKPVPASAPTAPSTKDCPYCFSTIAIKATRCPNCTAQI